jgi:hypothetical protein
MTAAIAAGLGYVIRLFLSIVRVLPGVVGPLAMVYGVWLLSQPAGYIVAGLVLWAWDVLPTLLASKVKQGSE